MDTNHSRRDVITAAALALVSTAMTSGTTQAETPTTDGSRTPAGDLASEPGSVIKTRIASCNCGQLTVTCVGPDPERRSLCFCKNCQMRTGSAFSIQTRFPRSQATIEGKSKAWTFPIEGAQPVTYRSCDSEGVTYHFCPECGSNVYYDLAVAPDFIGIKVGNFTDPTFPPPLISGFEEYRFPWAMNIEALPMPGGHHA